MGYRYDETGGVYVDEDTGQEVSYEQAHQVDTSTARPMTPEESASYQKYLDYRNYINLKASESKNSWAEAFKFVAQVAPMMIGVPADIGSAILAEAGITGASPAINAAVGSAAINAGTTAAMGGNFEQVLQSAASGAAASGINVQMGGGVTGAVTGSAAGTAIAGGDANQVIMNALAAGVGAGVQGATGSAALGSLARSTVITGEVSGQNLFNAAIAGINAGDSIEKTERSINNALEDLSSTFGAQTEGQDTVAGGAGQDTLGGAETTDQDQIVDPFQDIAPPPAEDPNAVTLDPITVQGQREQPVVSDVVTDVTRTAAPASTDQQIIDLIAQETAPVAEDPNALKLEQVTITGKREPESNVSPVVTDVSTGRPAEELDRVTTTYVTDPFQDIAPPQDTANVSATVTDVDTGTPATELDRVTVSGERETDPQLDTVTITAAREPSTAVTDVTTETTAPTAAAEEPAAKEEPKKEEEPRQRYPTVTGVPPKRRPRTPIITGATTPRLLADALAAYRPSGAIEGKRTGDERQDVWNEKSLRLRDALGL
jgi:hypothetical protein